MIVQLSNINNKKVMARNSPWHVYIFLFGYLHLYTAICHVVNRNKPKTDQCETQLKRVRVEIRI